MRKLAIAVVLLFVSFLPTTSKAGGQQHYVVYYSDSTFTTPVGKKFIPSTEGCDAPYDEYHETGTETVYIYRQLRDVCGSQGGIVYCTSNGSQVTCPSNVWPDDWWSLGEDW